MAFDFPSSPTTGQTYSVTGGPTYVYNGTAWVVLTPGNQFNRTVFTATAGQTTFTMNYVVGAVDVYRNGVKLVNTSDFTATNGTSIVLLNAATIGDTIEVISYPQIVYADAVRRTGDTMTGNLTVPMVVTDSPLGYRNRIINGAMEFNQRGAGILTLNSTIQYPADRWTAINVTDGTVTGRITTNAPTGFTKALYFDVSAADTSLAAGQYTNIQQRIEGFNISDFEWGTANAKSITVSFWVRASLTGTFAGAIRNGDNTRTYLFTFPINSANTYEYKTITIPGDTSGTWATDSSAGMAIGFTLGCGSTFVGTGNTWLSGNYINATGAVNVIGTTGANLYIGGVQLEVGSVATPFERRPYGLELALCQRYYEKSYDAGAVPGTATTSGNVGMYCGGASSFLNGIGQSVHFGVDKRTFPTITIYSPVTGASGKIRDIANGVDTNSNVAYNNMRSFFCFGNVTQNTTVNLYFQWTASAEL